MENVFGLLTLCFLALLALFAVLGWRRFTRTVVISSSFLILIWAVAVACIYVDRENQNSGQDGRIMAEGIFLIFLAMLTVIPSIVGLGALGLRRLTDKIK